MNKNLLRSGIGLTLLLFFQATPAVDLMESYQQALENAPALKAADAERLANRELLPQSRALWLPRLDASIKAGTDRWTLKSGVTNDYSTHSYGLSLSQTLYNRASQVQLDLAGERVAQAEAAYGVVQQNIILDVAQRYFDILAAIDNLEFTKAERAAIGRQLEQAQQRFDAGLIAITDVQEAQARHDSAASREITARNRLDSAVEALHELTGAESGELNPLSREIPLLTPQPNDIEAWVHAARENNLQLQVARHAAKVAQQEIKRRSAGHYPSLSLVGSYQHSEAGAIPYVVTGDLTSLSLQLNLPIYQGGGVSSRTRQARFQYRQASDDLEKQQRRVLRAARDAYRSVIAGISQVKALEQALASNRTALEATEAGFEVGTRTIVDVLNVQQELFRARRDHAVAHYDYLLATLRLKQAAGTLGVEDLQQVNRWLR